MLETTAKERPILFFGSMVRAILDGRETQMRRVVKPQPDPAGPNSGGPVREVVPSLLLNRGDLFDVRYDGDNSKAIRCPYGPPGDRLWVRETWLVGACWYAPERAGPLDPNDPDFSAYYRADGGLTWAKDGQCTKTVGGWRPSIHMPRWASRITLKVTGVRVERLNAINDNLGDLSAEGLERGNCAVRGGPDLPWRYNSRDAFRDLRERVNGPGSWEANPWVWVVEFTRLESGGE
jgi:hypothetical protein